MKSGLRASVIGVVCALGLQSAGCVTIDVFNPAFPATSQEIAADRARMLAAPVELARPVIVLSGYRSPSGASSNLARKLRKLTGADGGEILPLAYMFAGTIEGPARRVVEFVESRFPSDDPEWTTQVDVVAISMGGLVARTAAANPEIRSEPGGKRLNIHTLYTLASPHRGSILADWVAVDAASRSMAAGSELLEALDSELQEAAYEIVPYAVLRDGWVGAKRSAPVGQDPIWVPGRLFLSHHMVSLNKRIQVDVARRLRGEEPLGEPSGFFRD